MRPQFTKLIATILLGVFSVFLIPKEFVHALYGHKDTQEIVSTGTGKTIGTHHIHCGFLTYEASFFTITSATNCPGATRLSFALSSNTTEQTAKVFSDFPSLRGPPLS